MSKTNATYIGNNTVLLMNSLDYKMYVDGRDIGIASHLIMEGIWEHWISNAIKTDMRGAVVVDVGANFGWYSLLAAKAEARHVYAFEANPNLAKHLKNTVQVNGLGGKVDVHAVAVSDCEEQVELDVFTEWSGGGSALFRQEKPDETHTVSSVTLDKALKDVGSKFEGAPWVVKVDVEGFEPRVVLGAKELLSKHQVTAYVEYHPDPEGRTKLTEMLDFFEQQGFRMGHVGYDAKVRSQKRSELDALGDAEMLCFRRIAR